MNQVKDVLLRVNVSTRAYIGPGKILLLEEIERQGSISAAARSLKMSYRRAWLLIDALNTLFRDPVVTSMAGGKQGGGAALTDFGHELIERYRRMETLTSKAVAKEITALKTKTRKIKPKKAG